MQHDNIAKSKTSFKLLIVLLASFCIMCILGSTLAWFTNNNDLTGDGTTPNASTYLYVNGTQTNLPAVTQTITSTDNISKNVQFSCSNSNIDLLAYVSISINFTDGTLLENNDWVSINISNTNWTKGDDGRYYYNSKISKTNTNNKITIFDSIAVNNEYAIGKTLNIVVLVEVIQANQTAITALENTAGYTLPTNFKNLV